MKRSPLKRKTGLTRKRSLPPSPGGMDPPGREARNPPSSPPKAARKRMQRPLEPGEAEWKKNHGSGACGVCGRHGRVLWHHVIDKQELRSVGAPLYDPDNALALGAPLLWGGRCSCHAAHHNRGIEDRRIPYEKIPPKTRLFAIKYLGALRAEDYFRRNYR